MKKFIWNLLLFVSIPFIAVFSFDSFLRNQNSSYEEKYEGALYLKDSIEIIISGNSHANYGVDPSAFNLFAYNLANVAQTIYFDKRITISLIPYLKELKYVFISVDYHSLYSSIQPNNRNIWSYFGNGIKYKDSNYLLANISPALFGYSPKVSIYFLKKRIVNRIKYGDNIIDFDVENGVNLKDSIVKGFISYEGINESLFTVENYKSRINYFNEVIVNSNEKEDVLADLRYFIEILIENEITPILFTTPTYHEYNKFLETSIINENIKEINNICKTYNIEYWDFMNCNKFEKNDFYNVDHLNKSGALKFGKILNDSINKQEAQMQ